jgi:hypothetical protein
MLAKLSLPTSVAILTLRLIQPAEACHRFHVWNYPYPQRCDTLRQITPPARPVIQATDDSVPLPPVESFDPRTPEDIQDQREHDQAVADHKDALNKRLEKLHDIATSKGMRREPQ